MIEQGKSQEVVTFEKDLINNRGLAALGEIFYSNIPLQGAG